jgi:hypothetical protein
MSKNHHFNTESTEILHSVIGSGNSNLKTDNFYIGREILGILEYV